MSGQSSRLASFFYGLFPLLVAAGVLFVLVIIGGRAVQGYEMRQETLAMERRIDDLKRENRKLVGDLDYYRGDEYIEKVAREELGLVRPRDVPVVIVPPESSRPHPAVPVPVPAAAPSSDRQLATWQRWLAIFVDRE